VIAQDRPLCFFDLESTGINPAEDRIVEVCILRREIDGRETLLRSLVNPERQWRHAWVLAKHLVHLLLGGNL
jgi:DNA polymerase III epsilon subunit-like protein